MSDKIPKNLKDFINNHIVSVADLEGLLMLRENSGLCWNADELAERLYIEHMEAIDVLDRLYSAGFLYLENEVPKKYCYRPQSESLATDVEAIAEIYKRALIPITNLIHSRPKARIQEFANAFRLRKDT